MAAALVALFLTVGGIYRFALRPTEPVRQPIADRQVVEEEIILAPSDTTLRIAQAQAAGDILHEPIPEIEAQTSAPQLERQPVQTVADVLNIVSDDRKIESTISFSDFGDEAEVIFQPAMPTPKEPVNEESPILTRGESLARAAAPSQAGNSTAGRKIDSIASFTDFGEEADIVFQPATPTVEEVTEEDAPFITVSDMPKFQGGGVDVFRTWVQERLVYPVIAQENGIQGRVVLSFVIERDGTLTHAAVIAAPDRSLADEAVRIVKTSPKWTPGSNRGIPARVSYTLPVDFRLQ